MTQVQANTILLSAAVSACEKGSLWQQALQIFLSAGERDVIMASAAISALEKAARWQAALSLLFSSFGGDRDADQTHQAKSHCSADDDVVWYMYLNRS